MTHLSTMALFLSAHLRLQAPWGWEPGTAGLLERALRGEAGWAAPPSHTSRACTQGCLGGGDLSPEQGSVAMVPHRPRVSAERCDPPLRSLPQRSWDSPPATPSNFGHF